MNQSNKILELRIRVNGLEAYIDRLSPPNGTEEIQKMRSAEQTLKGLKEQIANLERGQKA